MLVFKSTEKEIDLPKYTVVSAKNKQDMIDTSITSPWSAISSVGSFPVGIYRLWVSRCDRFGLGRAYL